MKRTKRILVSPTIGTDAYTAGDVVGGLMTFAISTEQGHRSGQIVSMLVTDAHSQAEGYTLYIFTGGAPTTIADDAAFAPAIADLKNIIGTITVAAGDYTTVNSLDWALLGGHEDTEMKIPYETTDGNLYMYAVATDTPDYNAATDLSFTMTVVIDEL